MVFTTFGAVAGPNLVTVMGGVAVRFGIPALAGPFILAAVAFLLAGAVIFVFKVARYLKIVYNHGHSSHLEGENDICLFL